MDDFKKEDKIINELESNENIENVRLDERIPVEDDYGLNDGYRAILIVNLDDEFVETVKEEQDHNKDEFSNTLNGLRNTIELKLNMEPLEVRLYEKDKRDLDLDVGEMAVATRIQ